MQTLDAKLYSSSSAYVMFIHLKTQITELLNQQLKINAHVGTRQ